MMNLKIKNILNIVRLEFSNKRNNSILMGRWNYDYEKDLLERKVYLANMDHCGCCDNVKYNKETLKDEEYLKPYFY
jgi:hypothetical protein